MKVYLQEIRELLGLEAEAESEDEYDLDFSEFVDTDEGPHLEIEGDSVVIYSGSPVISRVSMEHELGLI